MSIFVTAILILDAIGFLGIIFIPFFLVVWLFYKRKAKRLTKNIPEKIKQEVENAHKEKERRTEEARRKYGVYTTQGNSYFKPGGTEAQGKNNEDGWADASIPRSYTGVPGTKPAQERRSIPLSSASGNEKSKRIVKIHKPSFL